MKCLICNKRITSKITFSDFFSRRNRFVCDKCYETFPIHINYNFIPLEKYGLNIYSIFDKEYHFKNDPFVMETSKIFNYLYEKDNNSIILLEKKLLINEYSLNIYQKIANINEKNIFIIFDYFFI